MVFSIEATRAIDDGAVYFFRMIRRRQDDHSDVFFEAVELVQEEGTIFRIDERIQVFENEHTWTKLPSTFLNTRFKFASSVS